MAPKGGNAKKESGRAKKAENEVRRVNVRIELPLPFGMSLLSGCELIEPLLCAFFAVKKKTGKEKGCC